MNDANVSFISFMRCCCFPPVGSGRVCPIHAERRDIDAAGRFPVRLRTPRKVGIFHVLLFSGTLFQKSAT